jgi:tetratricopeptide (TPR) repeat protein
MSAASPLPLLIKPDLRRRLQQRYEEAQRLTAVQPPDFARIHELLAECLHIDVGNTLYLDALVTNLQRRDIAQRNKPWLSRVFGSWKRKKAGQPPGGGTAIEPVRETMEQSILRSAADRLWKNPADAELLKSLATAAGEANLDQAEIRYWQLAAERGTQNADIARGLALALSRQGRFEEAANEWRRLATLAPAEIDAQAALSVLQPPASHVSSEIAALRHAWKNQPGNSETGLKLADALIAAEEFAEAEKVLADVQSAAGADLKVLEEREKLQMAKSNQRLAIARRWKAHDSHPKAKTMLTQLEGEHQRLEIEIWNGRTERMPNDWSVRLELARRLKQIGNFSGAIQRLEEAQKLKVNHPGAFIELGECFQHLRQYDKALELYEQAVSKAESLSSNDEMLKLARYRTGVLAAALGQREFARQNLQALVAADPDFKDARQRLDKLGMN